MEREAAPAYERLKERLGAGTVTGAATIAVEARENWEKSLAELTRREEAAD